MEEVHDMGLKEAVKYALSKIDPESNRHIHVSFDIDALDPMEAPATGTPGCYYYKLGIELLYFLMIILFTIIPSSRRINFERRNGTSAEHTSEWPIICRRYCRSESAFRFGS